MTSKAAHDATSRPRAQPSGIAPPAYRLPADARLGRVRLQVADLARSIAFYEGVLGFRVLRRTAAAAELGPHGEATPLVELHERSGVRPVSRRGRLGLYHFAIRLPDRPTLARFVGHLAERGAGAGMADHAVSEAVYLTDPDGLGIEVYADRPRESWRYEGRQLVMTTAPLDVENLRQAAQAGRWSGMPAGTVIGHVHLHVGDIEAAAAFYHTALGFDKVVWNYPGALFLSAGGYHHHLGTNTWAAGAESAGPDDARLLEWQIVVSRQADAEAAAQSLKAGGYAVTRADPGWVAADPWGTMLRLVSEDEAQRRGTEQKDAEQKDAERSA